MVTGTPCKPEPIIPKRNTVPGMPVEATNRHFVELKLYKYKIYEFWHKVQNRSEQ